ncbi:MAG: PKD domain-containing protein [Nitrospirota bacterium]
MLPSVSITLNAAVTVNAPDITAQLDCPTELWKNNVGNCTVTASTSWGNLQYEWTSSGVIVGAGNTATVSFPQQGGAFVSVKVSVVEVPAANVTLTSNIYINGYRKPYVTISGKRFIYVKESGTYSIGDVYSPSGPVDLTWSIDGQDLGTGDSITYTFNEVKKYILTVTSRVQGSGSDPDAEGVSTFNVYSSNYPAPKIAIERPRLIFLNEPADFKVKVYTQSGLDRQLFGRWVLPDGSYQQGDTLTYTFTTLDMKEIRYEAWFEGYEDNAASQSARITPREYVFPDYSIWSYTGSEGVVPYYAIFKADGNLQKATGKTITYNWDFGDGTFYATSRTRYARKEYAQPGQYSVTMQAIDEDGNTDTETFPINLRLPDPIVLAIKKNFTNRYMKAPLGAFLTTRKTGGHPRDGILTYDWQMNNQSISNKYAASVKMYDPGKYDLSLNINTKFGYSSSVTDTVTVTENQSPICDFTYDDKLAYGVTYFTAKCTDNDGSIVKYNWDFGNGTTSGMYRTYARYEAAGLYTVTLTGTDDSGAETKVTKTIMIQR